jgi:hypothetical protein
MSNLLLNECYPGAHVLLLGLEMSAPCCMIEPTQGDWRVVRSVKSTVVVLNARGELRKHNQHSIRTYFCGGTTKAVFQSKTHSTQI